EDHDPSSPGSMHTHGYFPDYLVTPPSRDGTVASIRDFIEQPDWSAPAFFYFGMRCYAEFRPAEVPPPHGDNLQAPCARMRERYRLEPVIEREVPNRGDVWLEYYGDAPTLRIGLYRVQPR